MKNTNTYTVHGWMVNELKLKGNELLFFAIVFGFSQDGKSRYMGSLSYIQDWLNCSRNTAIKTKRALIQKGYIIEHPSLEGNEFKYNTGIDSIIKGSSEAELRGVQKLNQGGVQKLNQGGVQKLNQGGVQKLNPILNTYNNTYNKEIRGTMSEISISDVSSENLTYFKIAKMFYELFVKILVDNDISPVGFKKRAKYKNYVNDVRLMVERDKRTKKEFRKMYDVIKSDPFWGANIRSIKTLRKQSEKLLLSKGKSKIKVQNFKKQSYE